MASIVLWEFTLYGLNKAITADDAKDKIPAFAVTRIYRVTALQDAAENKKQKSTSYLEEKFYSCLEKHP